MFRTTLTAALLLLASLTPGAAVAADMALVSRPSAFVRTAAGHSSEMDTEAMLGTPVRLEKAAGEWYRCTLPDSVHAYIHRSAVVKLTPAAYAAWKKSPRLVCIAPGAVPVVSDTLAAASPYSPFPRLSYLLNGAIVQGTANHSGAWTRITLPTGIAAYAPTQALLPLESLAPKASEREIAATALSTARLAMGSPYLWGGTSLLAPDCSGLVKAAYFAAGLILPRNASQQARVGETITAHDPSAWLPGDLLFFHSEAPGADPTRVTHVGIYLGNGDLIHSSGVVHISSIRPDSPRYLPREVIGVRRIASRAGTRGITPVTKHTWYF